MKVDSVFNIVGAAFTLAAIALVVARPGIITRSSSGLAQVINAATAPVRDLAR